METQKEAIDQLSSLDEENKKELFKMKTENKRLDERLYEAELKIVSGANFEELSVENNKLKRELNEIQKNIAEYGAIKNENIELKELLRDKEQLADTIEYLMNENKRFKTEQEEMKTVSNFYALNYS